MVTKIIINDVPITVNDYNEEFILDGISEQKKIKISFVFQVTSEDYHKITTLLYENNFNVYVPESSLHFQAKIHQYSTSVTNLYEKNAVGDFKLVLIQL